MPDSLPLSDLADPYAHTHIGLEPLTLGIFVVLAGAALVLDLGVHRDDRALSWRSAVLWSGFWVLISLGFALYLAWHFNGEVASLYIAGYIFELSLSVDNLFVIMAIFTWFKIPAHLQRRVLFWGILGAIVFRLIFVMIGAGLFALGPWVELLFAFMVALSGVMMLKKDASPADEDFAGNLAYRLVRHVLPVFPRLAGHSFFLSHHEVQTALAAEPGVQPTRRGAYYVTPLFLCLSVIETTDILFAFDSVPAVIAVSHEPLVIYSAMMFAVMGLRSLYFVLEVMNRYLVHLEKAVIVLLFFIAVKLAGGASLHLFGVGFELEIYSSLLVIALILALGIAASLAFPGTDAPQSQAQPAAPDHDQDQGNPPPP